MVFVDFPLFSQKIEINGDGELIEQGGKLIAITPHEPTSRPVVMPKERRPVFDVNDYEYQQAQGRGEEDA